MIISMKGFDVWQEGVLMKRKTLGKCTRGKKKRVTPLFIPYGAL
jgi:hypothetical protein